MILKHPVTNETYKLALPTFETPAQALAWKKSVVGKTNAAPFCGHEPGTFYLTNVHLNGNEIVGLSVQRTRPTSGKWHREKTATEAREVKVVDNKGKTQTRKVPVWEIGKIHKATFPQLDFNSIFSPSKADTSGDKQNAHST